jgi:two-component system, NarL family, sensor kinase
MLRKLFLSVLLFISINSYAQVINNFDSVEKVINAMPDDTAKANRLNELVQKLQYPNPLHAVEVSHKSLIFSEKIKYPLGQAIALRLRGVLYADKTILDSAKMYYDNAFKIVKANNDKLYKRQEGLLFHNYGTLLQIRNKYDSAANYYIEATKIFTSINEEALLFFPYNNLSALYSLLGEKQKALEFTEKAYLASQKSGNKDRIAGAVNNMVSAKIELKQFDGIESKLKENIALTTSINNYHQLSVSNNLLGQYFDDHEKMYSKAINYYKEGLLAANASGNQYYLGIITNNLGRCYFENKEYANAIVSLKKAIEISKTIGAENIEQYATSSLALTEEAKGNYQDAFNYLKQYTVITDTVNAKYNRDKVAELETKYETEKKEIQLKLQKATIKQKNTLNILFGSIAAAVLAISLFGFKNYKHKQTLQQQKIAELETQQQLTATEAVLKGEEQERTRLAKDLHDGLGGMLSGIKYSFNTMKGNMVMTPDNAQAFERSMDMLDSSIKEMRRVAHNMMPEALVKFGLDTALKDFCNEIQQSGALQISYQSIGLENVVIDQTVSITIYRIVQELINNTMKHAVAKNAIVQVTKSNGQLAVTVEDDGKGFDTAIINNPTGMGWGNITNRVEFLKGKLDVNSQSGKGTSVLIEINL